jgi:putative DNA primase/helicase
VKLRPLDFLKPLRVPIGSGDYELHVLQARPAPKDGIRASIQAWNGDLFDVENDVLLSTRAEREKYRDSLVDLQPGIDRAVLGISLAQLEAQLRIEMGKSPPIATEAQPENAVDKLPEIDELGRFRLTDVGNAGRFVAAYGDQVRYVRELGSKDEPGFVVYRDGAWRLDPAAVVRQAETVSSMIFDEVAATTADNQSRRAELARWAIHTQSAARIGSLLTLARSHSPLPVRVTDFDRDPMLLNVANGTIELDTGKLRPARATDLLLKQSPVAYEPAASAPRWQRHLREVFEEDAELIDYVQRALGYSVCGDQRWNRLFLAVGGGRNGKRMTLEVAARAIGDYGTTIHPELLLDTAQNADARTVALYGARLALASETAHGRRFATERVKWLSGGDEIVARQLYKPEFRFRPTHHLWLMTNHKPDADADDEAFWQRLRVIPFRHRFTKPDEGISEEQWAQQPHTSLPDDTIEASLLSELPGILAWLVEGARKVLSIGLDEPRIVRTATAEYRGEVDDIKEFLADCCDIGPGFVATNKETYAAYVEWAKASGIQHIRTQTHLSQSLRARGFELSRTGRERRISGLMVRPSAVARRSREPWNDDD